MSDLKKALSEYLALRRALGFKLKSEGRQLPGFVSFLESQGADAITVALALAWARRPEDGNPITWAKRLTMVRGFAKHLQAFDPRTEVPPVGLLPHLSRRHTPYLYSAADISALMAAARGLRPALLAATHETLLGLLFVTGMRVGEAIALDRKDVDWRNELLTVIDGKFGKSREVPLHPSTIAALRAYEEVRDRLRPRPTAPSFFISIRGTRLLHASVHRVFQDLVREVGLKSLSPSCRPRMHDFRHSFAVATLLGWYRDGVDVQVRLPLLSTYLGHVHPVSTYWYLSAAPELLSLAGARLEHALGELP